MLDVDVGSGGGLSSDIKGAIACIFFFFPQYEVECSE